MFSFKYNPKARIYAIVMLVLGMSLSPIIMPAYADMVKEHVQNQIANDRFLETWGIIESDEFFYRYWSHRV